MTQQAVVVRDQAEVDRLVDRLSEPRVAASLHLLLDNIELLAVMLEGLDGLARKGEIIGDTVAEVIEEVRAATQSTGLDLRETTDQLATILPVLADAAPVIHRVLSTPIAAPEPIAVLSKAAEAFVKGLQVAQRKQTRLSLRGLYQATKDEDVQRGLGFVVEVAKVFGQDLAATEPAGN
ncbi:MAG: DUF1641 domain-containing protein [Acidimicrobiales bacterium]